MIHWKPSTESCEKKSCARKDIGAHQCTQANAAQDPSSEKDRQYINTRQIIDDQRTTRRGESVRGLSRATAPSRIQDRDLDPEIARCVEDQKAAPTVHGEFE